MKNANFNFREPKNMNRFMYAPVRREKTLQQELEKQANMQVEIP